MRNKLAEDCMGTAMLHLMEVRRPIVHVQFCFGTIYTYLSDFADLKFASNLGNM